MSRIKRITLDDNADIRDIDENFQILDDMLSSETIVTIPADDPEDSPYTEETDSDSNTYYTIEINVTGMTSDYVGVRDAKPVYPRPFNVDGKTAIDDLFGLIQDGDSLEGKIKLYFNEKPMQSFQIYLYGVV